MHLKKRACFASVMIKIGANFLFACLVGLCCILRIKCPNLHRGRSETFLSQRDQQGAIYWHFIVVSCTIWILWSWQWVSYCDLSLFYIPVKWFKFFRFKSKSYIAKYNANTETESCLNLNFCHYYKPKPMWRRDYAIYNVEFVAAIEERIWSNL